MLNVDETEVSQRHSKLSGGEALLYDSREVSRNLGNNLLNVNCVSGIVPTLAVVGQVPQERDSGVKVC